MLFQIFLTAAIVPKSQDLARSFLRTSSINYLENFVIGSGTGVTIAYVVETIFNYYNLEYNSFVKVNESLLRSGDPSKIISDPVKTL